MTSSELMALKRKYLAFRDKLERIIEHNSNASKAILGSDMLLREYYTIDMESADDGYIKKSIGDIEATLNDFKRVLSSVNSKISDLERDIETARDKELAEKISLSGNKGLFN